MSYPMKMAPNHHPHHFMLHGLPLEPVSRTYQYRKIMKPMLERKRRARINKCLDELKDLMTSTLQADGENLSKLEKADILELTVRHLHRLRETNGLFVRHSDTLNMEKFWAGFQHCAVEVSHFLQKYNQQNKHINGDLIKYIANYVPNMAAAVATAAANANPTATITDHQPLPTAHIPQSAVAMQLTATGSGVNVQYQRFCTALRQHQQPTAKLTADLLTPTPAPQAAASAGCSSNAHHQQMQISTSTVSSFERIWEAATRAAAANGKHRMHPYARKTLHNHDNGGSGGGSSDDGDGDGDLPAGDGDGLVWRPW